MRKLLTHSNKATTPKRTIDPSKIEVPRGSDETATLGEAAVGWFHAGFQVLPILPGTKRPATKWDPWLTGLSVEKIKNHWEVHPNHEVAAIIGDEMIVFDADTPEAIGSLKGIEESHGVGPNMIVKTIKGEHHYFKKPANSIAKSDGHDSAKHPERIDIKTGRAYTILPPSTGKKIKYLTAKNTADLISVDQALIDSVYLMNGRQPPEAKATSKEQTERGDVETSDLKYQQIKALLAHIDSDCGYNDWLKVLMAVFTETNGSDEGLHLVDDWSSKGRKYPGSREILTKWRSFNLQENSLKMGTLCEMVNKQGYDAHEILSKLEPEFEIEEPEETSENPLLSFSLTGKSAELEKQFGDQISVLGEIALSGQLTVIYAAPNTGKTLITLRLLIDGINKRKVNPGKVFYVNMDDTGKGLVEKLQLAEEFGFHVLAGGYHNFQASDLGKVLSKLSENDQANGVLVILDTLKKFVDPMDKRKSSNYAKILRNFVLKGGTAIALSHTNKPKEGVKKAIYGGTSDFVDDSDCVYILETVSKTQDEKIVEFENIKRRGNVPEKFSFSYDNRSNIRYNERLLSVEPFEQHKIAEIQHAVGLKSDAEIIELIKALIDEGINTKMNLVMEARTRAGISRKAAIAIIEKYCGDEPEKHRWNYVVKERGRQVFHTLKKMNS